MKSGKYFIGGPNWPRSGTIETLYKMQQSEDRHPTLIYDVSYRSSVSFIGAGTIGETASGIQPNITDPLPHARNSFAPLERVVKAHVFTNNESDGCRGILLEYEDGIKRALGQCRLGFYLVQCYEYPTKLCHMPVKYFWAGSRGYHGKGVRVTFDSENGLFAEEDAEDAAKWEIYPMKGTLQFAHDRLDTALKIHDAWEPSFG